MRKLETELAELQLQVWCLAHQSLQCDAWWHATCHRHVR